MKKIFFLGACLVALISQPIMAQTSGADVVVVRVYDGATGLLIIARADGKTEEIRFNANYNSKGLAESSRQFQQVVAALYQQGYSLKSTFSGGGGSVASLIFIKEK